LGRNNWRGGSMARDRGPHGERGPRACNGGPLAEPPAEYRGKAHGQGVKRLSPLKLNAFLYEELANLSLNLKFVFFLQNKTLRPWPPAP